MCVSLWISIQRADGPMSRAVWRPSGGVVSESRSPDSTSTGSVLGAYGGGVVIGGSGRAGAGQSRQASNSSSGSVIHSLTVKGAKMSLGSAAAAAWYCASRSATPAW